MAEAAENGGNDAEATRAYACSYKMVAHPFTAYNLGRVSERSGDNELALKMFKAYLTLKPDAQDKEDVKNKVKALEEKIASGTALVSPETASGEEGGDKPAAPQEELAPPPEPKPAPVVQVPSPWSPSLSPKAVACRNGSWVGPARPPWWLASPQPRRAQQDERVPGRCQQGSRSAGDRQRPNAIPPVPWPTRPMPSLASRPQAQRWMRSSSS
jgi:hypothetical protein